MVFDVEGDVVGFWVGDYDRRLPLVIDPAIGFSTYLGGSASEDLPRIALAPDGSVVVAGTTVSDDMAVVADGGAVAGARPAGDLDAFVAKFDTSGTSLEYITYLGGTGMDRVTGVAVAGDGSVWVAGQTASGDFPHSPRDLLGPADAFLVRLRGDGTAIEATHLLGGSGVESGAGVAVDNEGFVVATGYSDSPDFPLVGSLSNRARRR